MPFRARCNPARLVSRRNAPVVLRAAQRRPLLLLDCTSNDNPTHQHVRHTSSGSLLAPLTSFFSRVRRPSPSSAQADFLTALSSNKLDSLNVAYDIIIRDATPSHLISYEQLLDAMRLLSSSSSGLPLLRRIYGDLVSIFGYNLDADCHKAMLDGLLSVGLSEEAMGIARTLDPSSVDWRAIMTSAVEQDPAVVEDAAAELRNLGSLRSVDYTVLVRNIRSFPIGDASSRLNAILREMAETGVILDEAGQAELIRVYILLDRLDKAGAIAEQLERKQGKGPVVWNAIVELYIARKDEGAVFAAVRNMRETGLAAPQKALSFLATGHLSSSINSRSSVGLSEVVGAIEHAERACGGSANSDVWAEVVRHYLAEVRQHDALDVALLVYDEARGRGVEVNAELAKTLIVPLCNARKTQRLDEAMRIYEDLMSIPPSDEASSIIRQRQFGGVYHYLLLACARSHSPAVSTAIRLLNDMRHQHLEITSTNLSSLLILLMRASPNHQSAFNIYAHFYALNPRAIDEAGFTAILSAYLGLSWDESPFAPPELFVAMMKDMQKAGYPPGSHILSALLKQYAQQATKLRRSRRNTSSSSDKYVDLSSRIEQLSQSIRDIHTLIKLDPLIVPDIPLLTSLMDAYSRSGAYSETFQVFDEITERRHREPKDTLKKNYAAAINVILDTCGWSYQLARGRKIWNWAKRWNLNWERQHWDSWVECLARNGEVEEAASVVLTEMGIQGVPAPDKETVRMLMKFVRKEGDNANASPEKKIELQTMTENVKNRWPEWWDEVGHGERRGK